MTRTLWWSVLFIPVIGAGFILRPLFTHPQNTQDAQTMPLRKAGASRSIAPPDADSILKDWSFPRAVVSGAPENAGLHPHTVTRHLTAQASPEQLWAFYIPKIGFGSTPWLPGATVESRLRMGQDGMSSYSRTLLPNGQTFSFSKKTGEYSISVMVTCFNQDKIGKPDGQPANSKITLNLEP